MFGWLLNKFAIVKLPLNTFPVILTFFSPTVCSVIFLILVGPTSTVTTEFEGSAFDLVTLNTATDWKFNVGFVDEFPITHHHTVASPADFR